VFQHYDADASGFIDADEFAFLAYDLGVPLTDAEVDGAVKEIDTSGDGKISLAGSFFFCFCSTFAE
jgi:Ca2+-binding EF-hand superfamily protein